MRIALAQINTTVGDIDGNVELIISRVKEARTRGADVVLFPELAISGYPPEDLLLKDHFVDECQEAVTRLAAHSADMLLVVGAPVNEGGVCRNAAVVLAGGALAGYYSKIWLPNYGVFDEQRYFVPGDRVMVIAGSGPRMAVTVCEDIWKAGGPGEVGAVHGGASVIVNVSMSPYHRGKGEERARLLAETACRAGSYLCYVNGVGGQDELVFDGQSMVFDPAGKMIARAAQFEEELLVVEIEGEGATDGVCRDTATDVALLWPVDEVTVDQGMSPRFAGEPCAPRLCAPLDADGEVYRALCTGVGDYVRKNRFERVVIGISGGIDSALTACIASDALGRDKVTLVSMPSRYSSDGTRSDAQEVAERLGTEYLEIPIEALFAAYLQTLGDYIGNSEAGVTRQNIQARVRGNLLMALSNECGWLVLTTGNKSEMAVGYATLYGDMAGGFSALKDVPKTLVYRLAQYRNQQGPGEGPIPASTISRPPSAELAPDQTDQDSLPPYDILDRVIEAYVVDDQSLEEMVSKGLDVDVVRRVIGMIDSNEYKRRQSAPGVRITPKAFGKDRRLPITNRYRG